MRYPSLAFVAAVLVACSGTSTGTGSSSGSSGASSSGGPTDESPPTNGAGASTSGTDKGIYCNSSSGRCSCFTSSGGNDVRCSTALLPGALCCADPGWPSQGRCECNLPCSGATNSCYCDENGGDGTKCEGTNCCKTETDCRCHSYACSPDQGEVKVATCTNFKPACPGGGRAVTSCSVSP